MVKRVAPLSYEAWVDYDLAGQSMSRAELTAISRLIEPVDGGVRAREGVSLTAEELGEMGLSPREARELLEKLQEPGRPDFELDLGGMRSGEVVAAEMYEAVPSTFE